MGTKWILHTETKGTGAQMVPLESVTKRRPEPEPIFVPRKPARKRAPEEPKPRAPHRFRIVDVMTRGTVVEDGSAREAVDALRDVRSIVDVDIYTWDDERERWRRLTLPEGRAMLELAHR